MWLFVGRPSVKLPWLVCQNTLTLTLSTDFDSATRQEGRYPEDAEVSL
jgi:hypothetical protein